VGGADHSHEHQGVDIADDGVGGEGVLSDHRQNDLVEQEDHKPVGKLAESVGHAQGDDPAVSAQVKLEFAEPQGLPMGKEVDHEHNGGGDLGQAGGQGGAPYAPVEVHHEHIVQHHIHDCAGQHADGADVG